MIKMPAIEAIVIKNLTKKFGDLAAVDHVSFSVKQGEIFGLLGPNGAGKTTLIRLLSTLTRSTEGTATVAGYDISKEDSKVREHIGLVSEKMIMYDRLTAKENLKLFGKLYDIPNDVLEKRIYKLLKLVRMLKWKDAQIGTFSTGMKQRINVARGLLNMPGILFLDEPTLGLDPQSTSEIREFIKRVNIENKTTIILTTHMMIEADMLCDRIGIIDKGKIVALDTSENLKKILAGTDTKSIELEISNLTTNLLSLLKGLDCVKSIIQNNPTHIKIRAIGEEAFDSIIDTVRKNDGKIKSINDLEPTLEDVFLHITGHEVREQVSNKVKGQAPRHGFRTKSRIR